MTASSAAAALRYSLMLSGEDGASAASRSPSGPPRWIASWSATSRAKGAWYFSSSRPGVPSASRARCSQTRRAASSPRRPYTNAMQEAAGDIRVAAGVPLRRHACHNGSARDSASSKRPSRTRGGISLAAGR